MKVGMIGFLDGRNNHLFKVEPINASRCLDLVKGNDVHGLNEVLEGDDLLLEVVH